MAVEKAGKLRTICEFTFCRSLWKFLDMFWLLYEEKLHCPSLRRVCNFFECFLQTGYILALPDSEACDRTDLTKLSVISTTPQNQRANSYKYFSKQIPSLRSVSSSTASRIPFARKLTAFRTDSTVSVPFTIPALNTDANRSPVPE